MFSISTIKRVCDWNEARYAREVSPDLQRSLLLEELSETVEAIEEFPLTGIVESSLYQAHQVKVMDGIGDILFVAIGGLWKHGLDPVDIQVLINTEIVNVLAGQSTVFYKAMKTARDEYVTYGKYAAIDNVYCISLALQFTPIANVEAILQAICTSNETKPAVKTDTAVKANIDKGATFVPPTEALFALIADTDANIISKLEALGI